MLTLETGEMMEASGGTEKTKRKRPSSGQKTPAMALVPGGQHVGSRRLKIIQRTNKERLRSLAGGRNGRLCPRRQTQEVRRKRTSAGEKDGTRWRMQHRKARRQQASVVSGAEAQVAALEGATQTGLFRPRLQLQAKHITRTLRMIGGAGETRAKRSPSASLSRARRRSRTGTTSSAPAIEVDKMTNRPRGHPPTDGLLALPIGHLTGSLGRRVMATRTAGAQSMKRTADERNERTAKTMSTVSKASEAADGTLRRIRVHLMEVLTNRTSAATAIASEIHCRFGMAAATAVLTSNDSGQPRTKPQCPAEQSAVSVAVGKILQSALDWVMTIGAIHLEHDMRKVLIQASAVVVAMTAASPTDTENLPNEAEEELRLQIGWRGRTALATAESLLPTTRGQEETEAAPSHNDKLDGVQRRGPSAMTRHSQSAAAEEEEVMIRLPRRPHRAGVHGLLASPRTLVAVTSEKSDGNGPRTMLAVSSERKDGDGLKKKAAMRRGEAITGTEDMKDTKSELTFGMTEMAETLLATKSLKATTE